MIKTEDAKDLEDIRQRIEVVGRIKETRAVEEARKLKQFKPRMNIAIGTNRLLNLLPMCLVKSHILIG